MRFSMGDILNYDLYFITDRKICLDIGTSIVEAVKEVINSVDVVQYREKENDKETMIAEAKELRRITREAGKTLIINDYVWLAKEVDADGLHIGQKDISYSEARKELPDKIIGVSVTTIEEAVNAEKQGADYVGVGPIFPTNTKKDADPVIELGILREIKKKLSIPVVAIGGIDRSNIENVLRTNVEGIAMISGFAQGGRLAENAGYFRYVIDQHKK